MSALLTSVETAAAWLVQPCSQCTCSKATVKDLDIDPDCPGLSPIADGCRSHSHVAARVALADAGVRAPAGTRAWLRSLVLAMFADLTTLTEVPEPAPGGLDPRRAPEHHHGAAA